MSAYIRTLLVISLSMTALLWGCQPKESNETQVQNVEETSAVESHPDATIEPSEDLAEDDVMVQRSDYLKTMLEVAKSNNLDMSIPWQPYTESHPSKMWQQKLKRVVRMRRPEVIGSLDKRIIQKITYQHSGELSACYLRELQKMSGLKGRVVAAWTISPQGDVTKSSIKESSMNNQHVEACIINSIRFWRFPKPNDGSTVEVEYPFEFNAPESNSELL